MADLTCARIAAVGAWPDFGRDPRPGSPGRRWENFGHATDELATTPQVGMAYEVAGMTHHPRVGEELLIPAGAVHSAPNVGKTTARWLYGCKRA